MTCEVMNMNKTELPKELSDKILRLIEEVRNSGGKLRKGTNEVTKSIERSECVLVAIASDVNPQEIIMHIPMLCEEKGIACVFVPAKADLGAASGLPVPTSTIAIVSGGEAAKKVDNVIKEIQKLAAPKKEIPKKDKSKDTKEEKTTVKENEQATTTKA